MAILALDPGGTTGVAIHIGETHVITTNEHRIVPDSYETKVTHTPEELYDLIESLHPSSIVFEEFTTPGLISKDGLYTVRLIGGIEAIAWKLGIQIYLHYPPERQQMIHIARAMLKSTGKKYMVHELDALAHLLVHEHRVKNGLIERTSRRRRV